MKLTINGEDREFASVGSVAELIGQLGMKQDRVAVELNREIVPRERWSAAALHDGDKLEIVHFVGGGNCRTAELPNCGTAELKSAAAACSAGVSPASQRSSVAGAQRSRT